MVSRTDGGRSGRAGFERVCIRDTARIQVVLIGDKIHSLVRAGNFLSDHTRPSHKNWSVVGRLSGVNEALLKTDWYIKVVIKRSQTLDKIRDIL